MNVQNCYFRSYVNSGFTAVQLHSEIVQVFGETSFSFSKDTSLGRPKSVRSPVLVNKVDELICKK